MAIHGEWWEGAVLTFAGDLTAPVSGNQADCVKTRVWAENGLAQSEFLRFAGF